MATALTPMTLDPRRRRALAIGVPIALALIAYGGIQFVSLAGQDSFRVDKSVTPEGGKVSVSIGNGNVSVVPSHDDQARVSGVVSYSIVRPGVRWVATSNGTVLDGPACPWMGNCGANVELAAPSGLAVDASSGSGNVTAKDMSGALNLYSGSGNVTLERASGPLVLGAGSGDVTGTDLSAEKVRANDGSGNVNLSFSRPPATVNVNDSSGNIKVALPTHVAYAIVANTSSGSSSIGVPTSPSSHHVVHLTADSGDIEVVPAP